MTTIAPNIAAEINRWHDLATEHASQAVEHAKRAGALLLQVKAEVPHGEFLPWLRANVRVTPRQCQRYMHAAQGKQSTPRIKCDKASHLEVDAPRLFPGDPGEPAFVPHAGQCYISGEPQGVIYLLEPSAKCPGYFFVSRLNTDDSCDYTRRPVHARWVEFNLRFYGLEDPAGAGWRVKPSTGVQSAMETLEGTAEAA